MRLPLLNRPLIGVTGPDRGHRLSWHCIRAAVALAGGRMVRLTPRKPRHHLPVRALIISGGGDVDPQRYGKERKHHYTYDHGRDALETAWVERAMERKLPLLGICRGAQLINVCLGGTLHLDIKLVCETAHYPDTILSKVFARKPVVLEEGSMLEAIFRCEVAMVNSLHRQSLEHIGRGLTVTAREENGIIQAVEGTDPGQFLLGVQWHPEFMLNVARQRHIFAALVRAVANPAERARLIAEAERDGDFTPAPGQGLVTPPGSAGGG